MWFGDRSLGAELTSDALGQICRANPTILGGVGLDVSEACPIIENYNNTGELDPPGGWLFHVWWQLDGAGDLRSDSFDPANPPLMTPSTLNTSSTENIAALGEAV